MGFSVGVEVETEKHEDIINTIQRYITEYDISKAFEALDNLGIDEPAYHKLKKEFIHGNIDVNFIGRLKTFVSSLK